MMLPSLLNSTNSQQNIVSAKKSVSVLSQASQLLTAQEEKISDFSSEGLANYFQKIMSGKKLSTDTIKTEDGIVYKFIGDGSCQSNNCYVEVDVNGEKAPNQEWLNPSEPKDIIKVHLNNEYNYIMIHTPDIFMK